MKQIILRLLAFLGFCLVSLVVFMLNPSLAYSHSTSHKNITIYHNNKLDDSLTKIISISLEDIKTAKIYQQDFQSDLCLNDGSLYPKLVKTILGDDVFTAFSNKVIVLGEKSNEFNRFYKWDRELKYSQFLNHALMHNLQFKYHGLLDSNPLGQHPHWKWEGYVEYEVLGQTTDLDTLVNIVRNNDLNNYDWVSLADNEGTLKIHVKYLAMTKFCFEVLEWDYEYFMKNTSTESEVYTQLLKRFPQTKP